jgi:hypothetical protein
MELVESKRHDSVIPPVNRGKIGADLISDSILAQTGPVHPCEPAARLRFLPPSQRIGW